MEAFPVQDISGTGENSSQSHAFTEIPTEIRVLIYNHLTSSETLNLRLVNRKIKQEIDEHVDFSIRLDQAYRGFRKLCRYHVKSCKITTLTHQNLHRGGLFTFPSRLKNLTLDGNISLSNLVKIFNHCFEITNLTITHETLGIPNLLSNPRLQQKFSSSLKSLTHLHLQLLRYPLGDPFESESNMSALLALSLPCLKSFKLYFSLWGSYLQLFKFLERHAKTLNDVELQVGDRGDARNTEVYLNSNKHLNLNQLADKARLKSIQLSKFNFRDDVLNLNYTASRLLLDILEQQTSLQVLQFHSPGDLSVANLRTIVEKNQGTFSEVVVYNLKTSNLVLNPENPNLNAIAIPLDPQPAPAPVLDMSIFQKCNNLRILALSCTSSNMQYGAVEPEHLSIKIFNLNLVPPTVERMHLTGFQMEEEEIIALSRNAVNLKEILIVDAGVMKYSIVLRCFLKNCSQLEYLNVRPVVTRANGDEEWWNEVKELSQLYDHFMGVHFDPIDDLDGFEAKINAKDRNWLDENISAPCAN